MDFYKIITAIIVIMVVIVKAGEIEEKRSMQAVYRDLIILTIIVSTIIGTYFFLR